MPLHNFGDYCQPDSAAGMAKGPGAPEEPLRHLGQVFGSDADPGIADGEHRLLAQRVLWPGLDKDAAAWGRELKRVREQVGGDLAQSRGIAHGVDFCEAQAEKNARGLEGFGDAVGCVLRDGGKVVRDELELEGGGFGGREPLQIVDHPGQAQCLIAQRGDIAWRRLAQAVEHGLVPGLQHSDGSTKLVRDVGNEVAS